MKKLLLFSLCSFILPYTYAGAKQSLADFGKMLKTQQWAIARSCEKVLYDSSGKLNATSKQLVKDHCACVARTTSNNPAFIKKMYHIAQHSRSKTEYTSRMEAVGKEIADYCQKIVNP